MSVRYISKKADTFDTVGKLIKESLWDDSKGPWENVFRTFTYFMPWIPGLGWFAFFADKIASFLFGFGVEDFGAWLDGETGKVPGDNIGEEDTTMVEQVIQRAFQTKSASSKDEFEKVAIFGGLMKLVGGIPRFTKFLIKILKMLLIASGVKQISNLYKSSPLASVVEPMLPKNKEKDSGQIENELLQPKNKEDAPSAMEEALKMQEFLKNPLQLTKLFL